MLIESDKREQELLLAYVVVVDVVDLAVYGAQGVADVVVATAADDVSGGGDAAVVLDGQAVLVAAEMGGDAA